MKKYELTKSELSEMLEKEYRRGYIAGLKAAHADKAKQQIAFTIQQNGEEIKFRGTVKEDGEQK